MSLNISYRMPTSKMCLLMPKGICLYISLYFNVNTHIKAYNNQLTDPVLPSRPTIYCFPVSLELPIRLDTPNSQCMEQLPCILTNWKNIFTCVHHLQCHICAGADQ